MKASKFTDAQKAFIIKQGADGVPVRRSAAGGKFNSAKNLPRGDPKTGSTSYK